MIFTSKSLVFFLSSLARSLPPRAPFSGFLRVAVDEGRATLEAALPGGKLGADGRGGVVVRVLGESGKSGAADHLAGEWALLPGWPLALDLLRKSGALTSAPFALDGGTLTCAGVEFATRLVPLDAVRLGRELDAAEAEVKAAERALSSAVRGETFAAGEHEQAGKALAALVKSGKRGAGPDHAAKVAEAERAHAAAGERLAAARSAAEAARAAAVTAERERARVRSLLALCQAEADCRALLAGAPQPGTAPASVGSAEGKRVLGGADLGHAQACFRYVWADGGELRSSDGYAIRAASASGELPAGGWHAAGLKGAALVAGARGVVGLHAGGWLDVAGPLGASLAVCCGPEGRAEAPGMGDMLRRIAGGEVVGRFTLHPEHAARLSRLFGLFDRVAVSAEGFTLASQHGEQYGRERWAPLPGRGGWGPIGEAPLMPPGLIELSPAGVELLRAGGSFELLSGNGAYGCYLRAVESGGVAVGVREWDGWAGVLAGLGEQRPAGTSPAPAAPEPVAAPDPAPRHPSTVRNPRGWRARRYSGPAHCGHGWGGLALRWARAVRSPDLALSAYYNERRSTGRQMARQARRLLRDLRPAARAVVGGEVPGGGRVRVAFALRDAAAGLRAAAEVLTLGGAYLEAERAHRVAAGWARAADTLAGWGGYPVTAAGLIAGKFGGLGRGRVLPGWNVGRLSPLGQHGPLGGLERDPVGEVASMVHRAEWADLRRDLWRHTWARPYLLTLGGISARRGAARDLLRPSDPAPVPTSPSPAPVAAPVELPPLRGGVYWKHAGRCVRLPEWFTAEQRGCMDLGRGRDLAGHGVTVWTGHGGALVAVEADRGDAGALSFIAPREAFGAALRSVGITGEYARAARATLAWLAEQQAPAPEAEAAPDPAPVPAGAGEHLAPVNSGERYNVARLLLATLRGVGERRGAAAALLRSPLAPPPTPIRARVVERASYAGRVLGVRAGLPLGASGARSWALGAHWARLLAARHLGALEALAAVGAGELLALGARVASGDPVAVGAARAAGELLAVLGAAPWRVRRGALVTPAPVPALVPAGGGAPTPPPLPDTAPPSPAPVVPAAPDTASSRPAPQPDTAPDTLGTGEAAPDHLCQVVTFARRAHRVYVAHNGEVTVLTADGVTLAGRIDGRGVIRREGDWAAVLGRAAIRVQVAALDLARTLGVAQ